MTLARRLAKLEASRTPTEIVLAWLAEVQAYPTLPEYVASLTDAPKESWPLERIGAQVETAVRASVKGKPGDVWQAVRRSVGDAFVLFELVLHLNVDGRATADVEGLRWALLTKWLGLLSAEAELAERTGHGDPEHAAARGAGLARRAGPLADERCTRNRPPAPRWSRRTSGAVRCSSRRWRTTGLTSSSAWSGWRSMPRLSLRCTPTVPLSASTSYAARLASPSMLEPVS